MMNNNTLMVKETMKSIKRVGLISLPLILILACVVCVSGLYAYPEDIELGGKETRGPVAFPHELHMDSFECLDCHHVMENGENILDESDLEEGDPAVLCGSCHNAESKIDKREAFHYQCMKCHDRYRFKTENTGPTLCGECHILKK